MIGASLSIFLEILSFAAYIPFVKSKIFFWHFRFFPLCGACGRGFSGAIVVRRRAKRSFFRRIRRHRICRFPYGILSRPPPVCRQNTLRRYLSHQIQPHELKARQKMPEQLPIVGQSKLAVTLSEKAIQKFYTQILKPERTAFCPPGESNPSPIMSFASYKLPP